MLALALVFSLNAITCSSSRDGFYSTLHAGSTFFRHFTVIRLASSLDAWNALQHAGCSARAAAGVGRRTPEQKRHFYSTPGCVVYTKNPSRATLPGFVLTDTSNAAEHQRIQLSRPQFCRSACARHGGTRFPGLHPRIVR